MRIRAQALAVTLTAALAWGQQGAGGSRGGNTTAPPRQPSQPGGQTDPLGEALGETNPDINRDPPAYVSGVVVMHDASPVPSFTQVELYCHGFRRFGDTVTGKGEFDLDLSGRGSGAMDASHSSQSATGLPRRSALGIVNLTGCFVRAELPGYRSSRIELGMHSIFDSPDIGEIVLTPLEGVTGTLVSATSLTAPKKAREVFLRARKEGSKKNPSLKRMLRWLHSAVEQYDDYAEAWDLLGRTQLGLGRPREARLSFEHAVRADARFTRPYAQLVFLLAGAGDMEKTIEVGLRALSLNPHRDDVRFYVTVAQLRAGRNEDAIESAKYLISRGAADKYPQSYQLLGSAYANIGDYAAAARYFERFLRSDPDATAAAGIRSQLEEWSRLGIVAPGHNNSGP